MNITEDYIPLTKLQEKSIAEAARILAVANRLEPSITTLEDLSARCVQQRIYFDLEKAKQAGG